MAAAAGRPQVSFTSGELDPALHQRTQLKYYQSGAKLMRNVQVSPHGGFTVRDGTQHLAEVDATACRLIPFLDRAGRVYDLVGYNGNIAVYDSATLKATVTAPYTAAQMVEANPTQQLDTLLMFHQDVAPWRLRTAGPTTWTPDTPSFTGIPTWDYGATYTNGVAAKWEFKFANWDNNQAYTRLYRFRIRINRQETYDIPLSMVGTSNTIDWTATKDAMLAAVLQLPNIKPGVTMSYVPTGVNAGLFIYFTGAGNGGDGWVVSAGPVTPMREEFIICTKTVVGVEPGEPIMSASRGWPKCGALYQQRLIMGGLKSLPNGVLISATADYYTLDERLTEANGAFTLPLDIPGGEVVERIVPGRSLMIFTSGAEYWVSDRAIDKTQPVNIVEASRHGSAPAVPIVANEGAALFVHSARGVIGEFRYAESDGNFTTLDLSLLGSHLVSGITDAAVRKAARSTDGNLLGLTTSAGAMRFATLLRQQEVTAFTRVETPGSVKAVDVNANNQMNIIVERTKGAGVSRRLERFTPGLLLDGAVTFTNGSPAATINGLGVHEGRQVWCIADDDVFGPFTVTSGAITLPRAVSSGYVGLWTAPIVETLTLPRDVGPNIVMQRPARIHGAIIAVRDTTSLAVSANGGRTYDVPLAPLFGLTAGPELQRGFTGLVSIEGLPDFQDEPTFTITQLRPGRLTVTGVTLQAKL